MGTAEIRHGAGLRPDRPLSEPRTASRNARPLRAETGWTPQYRDIRAGLVATVGWYRDHEDWWRSTKERAEQTYARLGR